MKKNKKLEKARGSNLINPSTNDFSGSILKDSNLNTYDNLKRTMRKDLSLVRLNTIIPTDAIAGTFDLKMEDEKTKDTLVKWLEKIDVKSKIKEMLINGFMYGDSGLYPVILEKTTDASKTEFVLKDPLDKIGEIKGINVYNRGNIAGIEKNKDILDEKFDTVNWIKFSGGSTNAEVHGSRVFHYQFLSDSKDHYGTPFIKTIKQQINVIVQTIEAIGINAFRSIIIHGQFDSKTLDKMKDEEKRTGVKVNNQVGSKNTFVTGYDDKLHVLNSSVFDSGGHYSAASQILCVAAGIPLSRWLGTQQGQLTGSLTDIIIYNAKLEEYRDSVITDAFRFCIDLKLKEMGKEETEYKIVPSKLNTLSELDEANIEKIKTESLKNVADIFNAIAGVNGKDIARENIVGIASKLNLSDDVVNTLSLLTGAKK